MDRSLFYDDIQGARPKFLYPPTNKQFPYGEAYSQNATNLQYGRNLYQSQMLKVPEQVAPQGLGFYRYDGRKHFPNQQRGEIDQYKALQNIFDPPQKYAPNYDRNLQTKDIEGAVTNTLISKVVKNKDLASVYTKPKSLWEPNNNSIDSNQEYQPRQAYIEQPQQSQQHYQAQSQLEQNQPQQYQPSGDLYKNKSVSNLGSEDQKQRYLEQLELENQQRLFEKQKEQDYKIQQDLQRKAEQEKYEENQRLAKQWEQQKIEQQRLQEQMEKQREEEIYKQRIQQQRAVNDYENQRQLEEKKKQRYANDLKEQVQSMHNKQVQTPNAVNKSHQIGQLLYQQPRSQQGQQKEVLDSLVEQQKKQSLSQVQQVQYNRFQPHELQQYIYDVKNGKINPGFKIRNTPTFMSYAGQTIAQNDPIK